MDLITQNTQKIDIYKKAERLVAAVFLVVDVMTETDGLKTKIKQLALDLISASASVRTNTFSRSTDIISHMENLALQIASFLDIASVSGLVSDMNAGILKKEFESFISDLWNIKNSYSKAHIIGEDFFKTEPIPGQLPSQEKMPAQSQVSFLNAPIKANEKDNYSRSKSRERAIFELIKSKGNVGIKDISKLIKGCSEKTIQRSLITMVNEGLLKKTGERRWSRYSVV